MIAMPASKMAYSDPRLLVFIPCCAYIVFNIRFGLSLGFQRSPIKNKEFFNKESTCDAEDVRMIPWEK